MKRLKIGFLIVFMLLLSSSSPVWAAETCPTYDPGTTITNSDKILNVGDTFEVQIGLSNAFTSTTFGIQYDSAVFVMTGIDVSSDAYTLEYNDMSLVTVKRNRMINGGATVTVHFKVQSIVGNSTITLNNLAGYCDMLSSTTADRIVTMLFPSTNTELESLVFSDGTLEQNFESAQTEYTLTLPVDVTTLTVTATPITNTSSVSSDVGTIDISDRDSLTVTVMSEAGTTKTYHITLAKEQLEQVTVKRLIPSSGVLNFSPNQFDYTIQVPYNVSSFSVEADVTGDPLSIDLSGAGEIEVGENLVILTIYAMNQDPIVYRITVIRSENSGPVSESTPATPTEPDEFHRLASLTIKGYDIAFSPDILEYYLEEVTSSSLDIEAIAEDKNATVTIQGNESLTTGSVISIIVTGVDGENLEYQIYIGTQNYFEENNQESDELHPDEESTSEEETMDIPIYVIVTTILLIAIALILFSLSIRNLFQKKKQQK